MIYQDPISSLNPRRRVNEIVGEGLAIWGRRKGARDKVAETLRSVGIDPEGAGRAAGRTSSPAGSASASRSPGRWCSSRRC